MSSLTKKEKRKIANLKYYKKNREKLLKNQLKKVHCDICNCNIASVNFKKHKLTKKHNKNFNNKYGLNHIIKNDNKLSKYNVSPF